MNLMAWFRKNSKKLMAVVVIALMIVFTIDPIMSYLGARRPGGGMVVARYGDNEKIDLQDRAWAQKQIEILKALRADLIFRPANPRMNPSQDLRVALFGELLFAERGSAAETINYLRQLVRRENLAITDEQINAIYEKEYSADIYWLLLREEARLAGIRMPLEPVKAQLEELIPRLEQGLTYSRFMTGVMRTLEVSEEQVIETFAEVMGILEYAKMLCSTENVTAQELLLETSRQYETLDAEYATLVAKSFITEVQQPSERRINEQFERYKNEFPGDVSENNPYGSGYKLPDRVRLEYIAVRMDDAAGITPRPTQQEMEDFYQQNASRFVEQAPSDPNDPNSETMTRTRGFAEVAGLISRGIYQQRVELKASQLISQAKSATEAEPTGGDEEQAKITDEEIKRKAGDYEKAAAKLSEEHKIKVYCGKTGLLSATDIIEDKTLGMLYLEGAGYADTPLIRVLFAVEPLKASVLGPVDVRPPRLYQNIGPLKDIRTSSLGYAGKCMMLVRIIDAQKAAAPEGLDQKIDKSGVGFENGAGKDVNTIRTQVIDDLKLLAAMDKAGQKAREFVKLAAKEGWNSALEKLNRRLGDPNAVTLDSSSGLRRISKTDMLTAERRSLGDPLGRAAMAREKAGKMLVDKLFALVPEDANVLEQPGVVVEFKPTFRYYCIKRMVINRLYQEQYDAIKAAQAVQSGARDSDELALTFYNPKNIVKRMNFQLAREERTPTEPNQPSTNGNEANQAQVQ